MAFTKWGPAMDTRVINFAEKFGKFSDHWSPKIVAQMNDYHFKLVKIRGEFVWHSHADTDEVFIVLDGEMSIHFRDSEAVLRSGEMLVIPRGVEHKPSAVRECRMMLVELAGTVNTGGVQSDLTAADNVWI
jgi:mannose-6-phosphate isomerase-like protein (cupin superfamily)